VSSEVRQQQQLELLQMEEAEAWFEYLEATRGQPQVRYAETEPWAWIRLKDRLRTIKNRRKKLVPQQRPQAA